jgi:hypothetical protein
MNDERHTRQFDKLLSGKTVKAVRRLRKKEMELMMWYKNPLVLLFTDGTQLILQCDDEGNDGGAAFYYDSKNNIQETIYTI